VARLKLRGTAKKLTADQTIEDALSGGAETCTPQQAAEYALQHPGERPYGYWAQLGREDGHRLAWWRQAELLLGLGALVGEELIRFERFRFPPGSITDPEKSAKGVLGVIREGYRQRRAVGAFFNFQREMEDLIAERQFRLNWHRQRGDQVLVRFYEVVLVGLWELGGVQ